MCDGCPKLHAAYKTSSGLLEGMTPGQRKKKEGYFQKVAGAIGMGLLLTVALPVVIVGGALQFGATGLGYLCRRYDGTSNGSKHKFTAARKGVRIYPM